MRKKTVSQIITVLLAVLFLSVSARAEIRQGDILSYSVNGDEITAFVANPEGKQTYELDCQVGTKRPESIESHPVKEDPVSVKTLILLDNSLSVRSEYREKISEILQTLVENHADNEQYTVACFSDGIEYLLTDSMDYDAVKNTIGSISYKDQETYLTDVLYDLLSGMKEEQTPVFRRIIIASDGVDNKSIGYTKEELSEKLKENPIPIYTLGCSAKNNEEQLKAMFALSRNSGGEGFLLDDLEDITDFIRSVKKTDHTIRATIVPAEEDRDGTKKGIRITLSTEDGTVQSSFNADMPFADLTAPESETAAVQPESTVTVTEPAVQETQTEAAPETAAEVLEQEKNGKEKGSRNGLIPAVIAAVFLASAVLIILAVRKKKNRGTAGSSAVSYDDSPTELISDDDSPTELITDDDEATMMVEPTVVLTNERDPEEVYSAELSKNVIAGRRQDCDIVIPEKTVSRQQFEIGRDGFTVWIRNLSDHGTMLDGGRLEGTQVLRTGSRITAGSITLLVEIR